tara:strand:+ start:963 stop:1136 length:174 start_codon:yes stop_codon:yes gene_type:complete
MQPELLLMQLDPETMIPEEEPVFDQPDTLTALSQTRVWPEQLMREDKEIASAGHIGC